jgi:hypothetical protein
MSVTGEKAYHERAANGNSRIVAVIKNFHFGLIGTVGNVFNLIPLGGIGYRHAH